MASYHRVLQVHGRSVIDKSAECDYGIDPWEILIDGERWDGKIRLVGFVDAFYLFCYAGESRFKHGIVVYKDDEAIRNILQRAKVDAADIGLEMVKKTKVDADGKAVQPKYFRFEKESGGLDYRITSLGHNFSLKTEYPNSALRKIEIKIRKPQDPAIKSRLKRGLKQHDLFDMMHDAVRMGILTHAELVNVIIGKTYGGSTLNDVTAKYMDSLMGTKGSKNATLSGY
ncbi:hypothetical protein B0J18DRAFT_438332 [Chaetomium sp. MPI-SDFR-AT-0129]|nr:hypothetical protein B0J18DRAFT_438332 [Chaetomium sp. MPI-SDFR-AT-0129]